MAAILRIGFIDYKTKESISWRMFEPFSDGYFDGVCLPVPGDIIWTNDNKRRFEVVRREFKNIIKPNGALKPHTLTQVVLRELEDLEEL